MGRPCKQGVAAYASAFSLSSTGLPGASTLVRFESVAESHVSVLVAAMRSGIFHAPIQFPSVSRLARAATKRKSRLRKSEPGFTYIFGRHIRAYPFVAGARFELATFGL